MRHATQLQSTWSTLLCGTLQFLSPRARNVKKFRDFVHANGQDGQDRTSSTTHWQLRLMTELITPGGTRYLPKDCGTKSAPKNFSNSRPCDLGLHHGHISPCTSTSFSRVFASWLHDLPMAQPKSLTSHPAVINHGNGKPPLETP